MQPTLNTDLPLYACHKYVRAARITAIATPPADSGVRLVTLTLALGGASTTQTVPLEYIAKHCPEVGGYFVRYADGYASYSPSAPFEQGYSRVPDLRPITGEQLDAIAFTDGLLFSTAPKVLTGQGDGPLGMIGNQDGSD